MATKIRDFSIQDEIQLELSDEFVRAIKISLPEKYEILAQAIADGVNHTDAYIKAFPKNHSKRITITQRVSRLLREHAEIENRAWQILEEAGNAPKIAKLSRALEVVSEILNNEKEESSMRLRASEIIINLKSKTAKGKQNDGDRQFASGAEAISSFISSIQKLSGK
ncbi:MAG: hypothetical protein LBL00_07795 [Endomicrobium sp.]|jgi:hypothetical protein|nr:hypothetical protein [Endomicrobium sp.]